MELPGTRSASSPVYCEELTLREIEEVLGVTESRVSQLRTKRSCA
jgi:DNA-directed RNA polymerase specialized sigma subunit